MTEEMDNMAISPIETINESFSLQIGNLQYFVNLVEFFI